MSFTGAVFLLGTLAVVGPLIAHLWARPRYKRVPFTMLAFLRQSQAATQSRRRLQDWLILLLRAAAIILLAMLFARPFITVHKKPPKISKHHIMALDDSLSMSYKDSHTRYMDKMIKTAKAYVRNNSPEDRYDICLPASRQWARNLTQADAMALIHTIKPVSRSTDMQSFIAETSAIRQQLQNNEQLYIYIASDFTGIVTRQLTAGTDSIAVQKVTIEPVLPKRPVSNAGITYARILSRDSKTLSLAITVQNKGQTAQNRRIVIRTDKNRNISSYTDKNLINRNLNSSNFADGKLKPASPAPLQLPDNHPQVQLMNITLDQGRRHRLHIGFADNDNLSADDSYTLNITIPQDHINNILIIDGNNQQGFLFDSALQTLAQASIDSNIRVQRINCDQLSLDIISNTQTIICSYVMDKLNDHISDIERHIRQGARLLIFMAKNQSQSVLQNMWQRELLPAMPEKYITETTYPRPSAVSDAAAVLDTVALKALHNYRLDTIPVHSYFICKANRNARCLWNFQAPTGLIYSRKLGKGTVLLINTSIDASMSELTKSRAAVALSQCLTDTKQHLTVQADNSNVPPEETDMIPPDMQLVNKLLADIFPVKKDGPVRAGIQSIKIKQKLPLWRYAGWLLWILLLAEPIITCHSKR